MTDPGRAAAAQSQGGLCRLDSTLWTEPWGLRDSDREDDAMWSVLAIDGEPGSWHPCRASPG
jgi:hypothetical protein